MLKTVVPSSTCFQVIQLQQQLLNMVLWAATAYHAHDGMHEQTECECKQESVTVHCDMTVN